MWKVSIRRTWSPLNVNSSVKALVPILVCGVVGGYVALVLAARNG